MREAILAAEETDPHAVAARCVGPIPGGKAVFYQKHMPHHMIAGLPRNWIRQMSNVFLIRHPARVIASYARKRENPGPADIGFAMQSALFDEISERSDTPPVVIDSSDVRANPPDILQKLCRAIGLEYDASMLSWPAGGHPDDGSWAPHWYVEVWKSTGFAPPEGAVPSVPADLEPLLEAAMPHYERLAALALK